jgi:hypothetical protein
MFQFRKNLPATFDKDKVLSDYRRKLTTSSPPLHPDFESAAARAVALLPPDWDRSYSRHCINTVPSLSSNFEHLAPSDLPITSAQTFRDIVSGKIRPVPIPTTRRVSVLEDSGKARTVTIASILQLQIAPLHRTLYDALVRTGAVLRGPATPASMSGFRFKAGETFVSGDYQAATDNFNQNNTRRLLQLLASTSTHVPPAIWDVAIDFLTSGDLATKSDIFPFLSGQLMGDLLSFPLLCLTNLTGVVAGFGVKYTKGLIKDRLLRINGDDIAFRTDPARIPKWTEALPMCGLLLETAKTLIHPVVFTLNSTFFRARQRRPRQVFFHRASSFAFNPRDVKDLPRTQRAAARAESLLGALASNLAPLRFSPRLRDVAYHLLCAHAKTASTIPLGLLVPRGLPPVKNLPSRWRKPICVSKNLKTLKAPARVPALDSLDGYHKTTRPPRPTKQETEDHAIISQSLGFRRGKPPSAVAWPVLHSTDCSVPPWKSGQDLALLRGSHAAPSGRTTGKGIGFSDFLYRPTPGPTPPAILPVPGGTFHLRSLLGF